MPRFHPADYPAYTFNPETGTPVRETSARRGPYANLDGPREVRPVKRRSDGRECFHLQRKDGAFRLVSRDLILATLNPWDDKPEPEPFELPPWSFEIEGYAGYAVVLDPFSVIRYHSPAFGTINPPTVLKATERRRETLDRTYIYHTYGLVDENTGLRRAVQAEKIMELAGITAADIAAARKRALATRTPAQQP